MFDHFANFLRALLDAGPLLSALPIAIAVAVQVFAKLLTSRALYGPSDFDVPRSDGPDWEKDTRLSDARQALVEQKSAAKWNSRTVNSLTFGQYIIGGVLATSFVQSSLSATGTGFLGVLVLVSSLIHQRYRPDVKAKNGYDRAARLKQLIRDAEDIVFDLKRQQDAQNITKVRQLISKGLADIERSELNDLGESNGGEPA